MTTIKMKLLNSLFYTLYSWLNKNDDIADYKAVFAICLLFFINILSLPALIELIAGQKYLEFPDISKLYLAFILIAFYSIFHFLLLHKKKYQNIIDNYEDESTSEKTKRNLIVAVYILVSLLLLFVPPLILLS